MSDTGRKDLSDKAKETIVPDAMKSDSQKAKEGVTDATDKVARGAQTDQSKSATQQVADMAGRTKDTEQHGSNTGGVMDSVKHAVGLEKGKSDNA